MLKAGDVHTIPSNVHTIPSKESHKTILYYCNVQLPERRFSDCRINVDTMSVNTIYKPKSMEKLPFRFAFDGEYITAISWNG